MASADGKTISIFLNFDAPMYWLPLLREAAAQWRQGTVPLWNPYQALGTPLLATLQVGALYPLNVLYLWMDAGHAWFVTIVVHHVIAGIGLYAYARALTLSPPAAVVGSTVYMFSWLLLPKIFDQPQFICLAWLPVLFACTERLLIAPSLVTVTQLVLVWSLQILGGHPETIAASALLLGAYVVVRTTGTLGHAPRHALLGLAASAASAALVAGVTAAQWLPTYELLQSSMRAPGTLTAAQQGLLSADFWNLLGGLPGRAPLAVALIGLWTWRRRSVAAFFGVGAVIVAALAAGPAMPLAHLIRDLPMGTWFRAPSRLMNMWPLCVALLVAAGTDALTLQHNLGDRRRRIHLAVISAFFLLIARVALTHRADLLESVTTGVIFDLLPLAAVVIGAGMLSARPEGAWIRRDRELRPAVVLVLLSALPIAVRYDVPQYLTPLGAGQLYAEHADVFAWLRSQSPARVLSLLPIADGQTWAKLGTYFEVPVLNDYEPLTLMDFQTFAAALSGPDPNWFLAAFMGGVAPPHPRFNARLFNLSGVRFILAAPPARVPPQWFPPDVQIAAASYDAGVAARDRPIMAYENRSAAPRAFFIAAERMRPAGANCLASLQDLGFDPSQELLLETEAPPSDLRAATAHVQITRYAASEVRLEVDSDRGGFVVLSDAFFPGWAAEVDATAAPVLRADCFFRAVPVNAGAHSVILRYTPRSFAVGVTISLITAGLLMATRVLSRPRSCHAERMASSGDISPLLQR